MLFHFLKAKMPKNSETEKTHIWLLCIKLNFCGTLFFLSLVFIIRFGSNSFQFLSLYHEILPKTEKVELKISCALID